MDYIIEVSRLRKEYGSEIALSDISFNVKRGSIFGFLGKNGAGKTTTIKSMTGQITPTAGVINIMGYNASENIKEIHQHIGIVSEHQNLYENFTVFENIDFFRKLYNIPGRKTLDIIEALKLEHKIHEKTSRLSKGLKQKVLLSRAILHSPKLVFLDEPSSGLDPSSAVEVHEFILKMKQNGTTVFLTTHSMEEADQLCDYVTFISNGQIKSAGSPADLKKKFGKRLLEIKYRKNDQQITELLDMENDETYLKIMDIRNNFEITSIHSMEASMKDVFLKVTGDKL